MRLSLTFPATEAPIAHPDTPGPNLALSPDGTRLVYVGHAPQGSLLYLRPLDQFAGTPIPGTAGAMGPFFSPDGRWVAFWSDKKLRKVSLSGGQPLVVCDASTLRGADWGSDGSILFSPYGQVGLFRVSDQGGEPKPVTTLDKSKGEGTHRWPQILPGGKAAIFTAHSVSGSYDNARIGLVLLETGERRTILEGGTDARYLPTGHLLYLRGSSLYAVPFDPQRLVVSGPPVPALDGLETQSIIGLGDYVFSSKGNLIYFPRDSRRLQFELVWLDRKGSASALTEGLRAYEEVRLSPDGRFLAAVVGDQELDIWLLDLARGSWERLTSGGLNSNPVWAPDGKSIAYASNRGGTINPFRMAVDRSRPPEQLAKADEWIFPVSFSPDGRTLLLLTQTAETHTDISVLTLDGDGKPRPFIQTPATEENPRFSPDGRFVAYDSDASGRPEVYVAAYPGPAGRWRISTEGGFNPQWSRDGRELVYSSGAKVMAVTIETRPQFTAGVPRLLFERQDLLGNVDVASTGQRFVGIRRPSREEGPASLTVVLNWFDDLRRRMAAEKKAP
jgi:Tol biopolymer transport system component